ncbi:ladinin-1 isoform X5 [Erpetoichthys calabaricus]|uniref:ladinin-1 isoform X5 n=1 Tax=Erpetoichthys calabaricus TaxID=27687 RepID=UPI0022346903|nr:ladinin-1 isoform X5 [Erpetoichthys calabaricus]
MSLSRKNWSALSSLTRQWTVEDEEEVEREKRRRNRSFCSTSEAPEEEAQGAALPQHSARDELDHANYKEGDLHFLDMLKSRDEERQQRQLETLMQQREEGEEGTLTIKGEDGGQRRIIAETQSKQVSSPEKNFMAVLAADAKDEVVHKSENKSPSKKFVSSLSISFDKSADSRKTPSPLSPVSPSNPVHLRTVFKDKSIPATRTQENMENGPDKNVNERAEVSRQQEGNPERSEHVQEDSFKRLSSRSTSFRQTTEPAMSISRIKRSSSLRYPSRKEDKMGRLQQDSNGKEESTAPFQRNTKLRNSSRTIEEKLERLAMAAQKSELVKSPTIAHKEFYLPADDIARKRDIFEREATSTESSSGSSSRKEKLGFAKGISERISQWVAKTQSSQTTVGSKDYRKGDVSRKRNIWEDRGESQNKQ